MVYSGTNHGDADQLLCWWDQMGRSWRGVQIGSIMMVYIASIMMAKKIQIGPWWNRSWWWTRNHDPSNLHFTLMIDRIYTFAIKTNLSSFSPSWSISSVPSLYPYYHDQSIVLWSTIDITMINFIFTHMIDHEGYEYRSVITLMSTIWAVYVDYDQSHARHHDWSAIYTFVIMASLILTIMIDTIYAIMIDAIYTLTLMIGLIYTLMIHDGRYKCITNVESLFAPKPWDTPSLTSTKLFVIHGTVFKWCIIWSQNLFIATDIYASS